MSDVPLSPECNPQTTLETALALQFRLEPPRPWRSVIVWRDGKKTLRPLGPHPLWCESLPPLALSAGCLLNLFC